MSGICGIIRLDGVPVDRAELESMTSRAAYRGVDGIEYHCEGPVGIACLSLDTTPDGTGACRPLVVPERGLVFAADARLDNRDDCAGVSPHLHAGVEREVATDAELMLGMLLQSQLCLKWARLRYDAMHAPPRLERFPDLAYANDARGHQTYNARDRVPKLATVRPRPMVHVTITRADG